MSALSTTASTREGRFGRSWLLALLAGGWGSMVFDNVNDPILAAPFFVLTTLATAALGYELYTQARRPSGEGVARWERSDTAIVTFLVGLAAVISVVMVLRPFTAPEQSARASFAVLYVVLASIFAWQRSSAMSPP
ncbi:hypothetical protein [Actinoplanes sp. URMC 104]|uniref:hypothetical protein n=1 Tax=Actinoplanes sp. URMC 104 TaxID=3423409 RepID=UPI003F1B93ED